MDIKEELEDFEVEIKQEISDENSSNPWNVPDVSVFLKYCCPECDFSDLNLDDFTEHALTCHEQSVQLFHHQESLEIVHCEESDQQRLSSEKCHLCDFFAESSRDFCKHFKAQHEMEKPPYFICDYCDFVNEDHAVLDQHSMYSHQAIYFGFHCQTCHFKASNHARFLTHLQAHLNETFEPNLMVESAKKNSCALILPGLSGRNC